MEDGGRRGNEEEEEMGRHVGAPIADGIASERRHLTSSAVARSNGV